MARKQTTSPTRSDRVSGVSPALIEDIRQIIGEARRSVATTVNAGLTLLYWRIGKRIVNEVLGKERAAYGQQIVVSVARLLVQEYGPSFGEKNLRRMMQFAEVFPEEEIVVSLIRQLSWTHFIALLPIKNSLQVNTMLILSTNAKTILALPRIFICITSFCCGRALQIVRLYSLCNHKLDQFVHSCTFSLAEHQKVLCVFFESLTRLV